MGFYQFKTTQMVPLDLDLVWEFISSPANLKQITPEYMGFDITSKHLPEKIYPGLIISYRLSIFPGIRTTWITEITHVKENSYFVDEQRSGPYALWHHEHHLKKVTGGVLMTDIVSYKPPLGIIGSAVNHLFIKQKLKEIFTFRTMAIEGIFGISADKSSFLDSSG
jgi:ligand-binding SRPBCC domain-containing protein